MHATLTAITAITSVFFFGSVFGWCLELIYRRIFSSNGKWTRPGVLVGPYMPMYGVAAAAMYSISEAESVPLLLRFALMCLSATATELASGLLLSRGLGIIPWDYSHRRGNLLGLICPLFSLFWTMLAIIYYYAVHPLFAAYASLSAPLPHVLLASGLLWCVFSADVGFTLCRLMRVRRYATSHSSVHLPELRRMMRLLDGNKETSDGASSAEDIGSE